MGKMIIKGVAILILLTVIVLILLNVLWIRGAHAEEEEEIELNELIVIAKTLNGRYRPSKKSPVLAEYEFGDHLTPTGKWSKDHAWVEIIHPEEGSIWVNINYISERLDIFEVYTLNNCKIKVRKYPGYGKVTKYLNKEQHVEVDQVIMGFGHTAYGWIDLSYFIEEPKDEYAKVIQRK